MTKRKKAEEWFVKSIEVADRFVGEVGLPDILILSGSFIAGTQGWTPLSAIIKVAPEFNFAMKAQEAKNVARAKLSPEQAQAVESGLDWMNIFSSLNPLARVSASAYASSVADELGKLPDYSAATPVQQKAMRDYYLQILCMGIVGMVEGYVISRPGTIAGIGEIIKGIGEMIPG